MIDIINKITSNPSFNFIIMISFVVLFANIIFSYIIVFVERKNPVTTWAWLLVLIYVPFVGFIFYLLAGRNLRKKKMFKTKEVRDLEHLRSPQLRLIDDFEGMPMSSMRLGSLCLKTNGSIYTDDNKITILNNGDTKFPALIKALNNAKHHIHLEYYILRDDGIGKEIKNILIKKAKEGVEVRLLVDGMGNYAKKRYFNEIRHAGGQTSIFFPPTLPPFINLRINYRNHRKIALIDGEIGFFGGSNIGDEYLSKSKKYGYFRDINYMITGSAVKSLQNRFFMDWEFSSGEDIPVNNDYFKEPKITGKSGLQILTTGPDSAQPTILQAYLHMITNARESIYIATPYFVPDESLTQCLKNAILEGIDVRIIIPSVIDHPFVHWASTSHMAELIELGGKCYEYSKGFLHSKLIVTDESLAMIGTANCDARSFHLNFEVNGIVYDKNIAKELSDDFMMDIEDCILISKEIYDKRSKIVKIKESISRLMSPIL